MTGTPAVPGANHAGSLLDALGRSGYRLTGQRRAVAELIAAREGHFTAADLAADAARVGLPIGRATLFRALDLLAELGLVERVDLPAGEHAYVACDTSHHHHAICTRCGRSLDVDDLGLADVLTDAGERLGFRVTSHRLELFGVCATCQGIA